MNQNVDPDNITWIMPNDAWLINRDMLQPNVVGEISLTMLNVIMSEEVKNAEDLFLKYEKGNTMMRIDEMRQPTTWKCATVSSAELIELKKVRNIIRQGRIDSIEKDKIIFKDKSEIPTNVNYLHVDCTSNGLGKRPKTPVFNGNKICLQSVYECQQVFSAAIIGALEARFSSNDELMNKMCIPVPHPEKPSDYVTNLLTTQQNLELVGKNLGFGWLRSSRLCVLYHFSFIEIIKVAAFDFWYKKALNDKLELLAINSSK